jgi:ketosteroid isomerase-like protein
VSQENIEIHRRLQKRINAGDIEGQLEFIHPDIELFARQDDPGVAVIRGREGYRRDAAETLEIFDNLHFEVVEYTDAGEYLVVIGRLRGKGHVSGAPLEDLETIDRPQVRLWRFRDGLAIEFHAFRTKEEALEAAGLRE